MYEIAAETMICAAWCSSNLVSANALGAIAPTRSQPESTVTDVDMFDSPAARSTDLTAGCAPLAAEIVRAQIAGSVGRFPFIDGTGIGDGAFVHRKLRRETWQ